MADEDSGADGEKSADAGGQGLEPQKDKRRPGIIGGIAGVTGFVFSTLETVAKLAVNIGIVAGIIIGGPVLYKLVTKPNFVINDITVPGALEERGYTGNVVAQQILDHIAEIDQAAGSKKEKAEISGFDLESSMPSIQLPVGGLNLAAIVSQLRQLLGVSETKITGEVFVAVPGDDQKGTPPKFGLRLRISGEGAIYKSTEAKDRIEPLIEAASARIMRRYDAVNLGYYYYRQGNLHEALAITDEVLADANPENGPWAFTMRGLIARDRGDRQEAALNFREAIRRQEKFWLGHVYLSDVERQDGRLDLAEVEARKAIALAPDQQEGYAALAVVQMDQGKESEALVTMKKGIDADPKDPAGHMAHGHLLTRLKRFEEALLSFKTSAVLNPSAEPLIRAAGASKALNRNDEAYILLRQAAQSDPASVEAWIALGDAAIQRKDPRAAASAFQKAIDHGKDDPLLLVRVARALADEKHVAEAEALFTKSAKRFAHNPDFLLGWSDVLWRGGIRAESLIKLREAIALAGDNAGFYETLGRSFVARGDNTEALRAYQKAVNLSPRLEEALKPEMERVSAHSATAAAPSPASGSLVPGKAPAPAKAPPVH